MSEAGREPRKYLVSVDYSEYQVTGEGKKELSLILPSSLYNTSQLLPCATDTLKTFTFKYSLIF